MIWRTRLGSPRASSGTSGATRQISSSPFLRGVHGQQPGGLDHDVAERELDLLQLHAAGLDLRQIEDVVQQHQQRVGRFLDDAHIVPLLVVERSMQHQLGHAQHAVHGRANLVAHGGQESALGLVGAFGRLLRGQQLFFGLRAAPGRFAPVRVRDGQLLGTAFGGGRAVGDALLQRVVQLLQLGEAFGVLERRAGDRGDEVGQPLLVGAEQLANVLVRDVQAGHDCGLARESARTAPTAQPASAALGLDRRTVALRCRPRRDRVCSACSTIAALTDTSAVVAALRDEPGLPSFVHRCESTRQCSPRSRRSAAARAAS